MLKQVLGEVPSGKLQGSEQLSSKPACLGAFRETFPLNGISRSRGRGDPSLLLPPFLSVEANHDPAKGTRPKKHERQETGQRDSPYDLSLGRTERTQLGRIPTGTSVQW